jgi:glycosyltransferase involved in cell wall biosynthesis
VPSVCILSLSAIADDPRVRRQGDAFCRAGWSVTGVGVPGAKSLPPSWPIRDGTSEKNSQRGEDTPGHQIEVHPPWRRAMRRLPKPMADVLRLVARPIWRVRHIQRLGFVRLRPESALDIYWSWPAIRELYAQAAGLSADVWLANDWTSLPVAMRLAAERGGHYGYDTHEFALEEYAERASWRILRRPMVHAIEGRGITGALVVSAVSAGIAEELQRIYSLAVSPLVIRNTPSRVSIAPRRSGSRIRVLYHGLVAPGRGLEATIRSVPLWRREFDFTIRGPGTPKYISRLQAEIERLGIGDRVFLAPPVPMTELVREASSFDIGYFALPDHSGHNRFVLPNKFFEYAMAGLALCVSDLPEMTRLIEQYQMGVTLASLAPADIADAINRLNLDSLSYFRSKALAAANELCWEQESERLVAAYARALDPANPEQRLRVRGQ